MIFSDLEVGTVFRFDFDRIDTRFIYRVVTITIDGKDTKGCIDLTTNRVYTITLDSTMEVHILDEKKALEKINKQLNACKW